MRNLRTANVRARADVPHRLMHDFRRTAARRFIRCGVSEHVAMKLGGWRDQSVFRRYNIIDENAYETQRGGSTGWSQWERGETKESSVTIRRQRSEHAKPAKVRATAASSHASDASLIRFGTKIPASLDRAMREHCALHDIPLASFIAEALCEKLASASRPSSIGDNAVSPRIASGSLRAGLAKFLLTLRTESSVRCRFLEKGDPAC